MIYVTWKNSTRHKKEQKRCSLEIRITDPMCAARPSSTHSLSTHPYVLCIKKKSCSFYIYTLAFLRGTPKAFSLCILLVCMLFIYLIVLTQPQLKRNPFLFIILIRLPYDRQTVHSILRLRQNIC